ncbi:Carboxymethylenebutenolidase OS=Streptomyces violarus OX=67380 GN=FHS41_007279 PE=4 SV=1 [Streptomyces violarus]
MTAVQGTAVDITTEDGTADAYLTHPAGGAAHPAVLLYMDAFGLRPRLRSMADRLAGEGYTVLVPNVFYRHGRAPLFDLPEFIDPGARPEIFERIMPVMQALTPELAMRDAGCLSAPAGRVARGGRRSGRCDRLLHGGAAVAARGRDLPRAGRGRGRLPRRAAGDGHAGQPAPGGRPGHRRAVLRSRRPGPLAAPEQIERLEEALTAAGVRHRCEVYTGAPHGFTQADTASYDKEADERHWSALLDLLKRDLTSIDSC